MHALAGVVMQGPPHVSSSAVWQASGEGAGRVDGVVVRALVAAVGDGVGGCALHVWP